MENLNLAELLRDCPTGMELDCTVFDNVNFDYVNTEQNRIYCKIDNRDTVWFTAKGCINLAPSAKCAIFPKGKTTWEGFVPPCKFKDGDIIYNQGIKATAIFYKQTNDNTISHCFLNKWEEFKIRHYHSKFLYDWRFATEEEKQKLFDAIKANGYKWNAETKTLEKLPKFKVGNRIKEKEGEKIAIVERVYKDSYDIRFDIDGGIGAFTIDLQDEWELVPNKFDITYLIPFESLVLVREDKTDVWRPAFYGFFNQKNKRFYTANSGTWLMCIPYNEGTKHLTGTTNDCDPFFKTWDNNN